MKKAPLFLFTVVGGMIVLAGACRKGSGPESGATLQTISLGEKIFTEKQCGKCHPIGDQSVQKEMPAPDLTSVFLAVDTVFINAHLNFVELSQMPPLDLTPEERIALTKYVASLHAKVKTDPNLRNPDGLCCVCGAPLQRDQAQAAQLLARYADQTYYFECPDCKRMFEMNPSWYAQHGYLTTR